MNYPAYPEYRNSGVESLGQVPQHWEIISAKLCYEIQLGKMLQNNPASITDQEITYLKALHVTWSGVKTSDLPTMWASTGDLEKYAVNDGDMLVCEGGEVGRASILRKPNDSEPWIIQNALHRVRGSGLGDVEYFNYLLRHIADSGWFDILCNKATIAHLTGEKLGALKVSIPDKTEQQTIAQFLDHKTQQIDQLIAKKQTLIDKLNEQRIALITHAVTKGLNPDVEMKSTGIRWLEKVPKTWQKRRLKFVVQNIVDTEHKTAEFFEDGDYLVVRTTNVRNGKLILDKAKYTNQEVYEEWTRRATPKAGDILFTREAPAGEACIVPNDIKLCIGQRMVLFQFDKAEINPVFLLNALQAGLADEFIKKLSLGSTVAHFNMSDIQNIPILLPSVEEQNDIASYLGVATHRVDRMIDLNQQTIDKLREYRTALITAAVTGKIDLRHWQEKKG
ncbi:MAG: restriction endonuclease subunit S [Thiolinea sp.]